VKPALGAAGSIKAVSLVPHALPFFRTGSSGGKLITVTFEGMLRVKDPARLLDLLENGIGPAKAFGPA
jgi:CRISPR system Cascade subunit CasE